MADLEAADEHLRELAESNAGLEGNNHAAGLYR